LDIFFHCFHQALLFTLKQLPYMVAGLFLAEMMVAMQWIEKLAWATKALMRYAHLDAGCGIPFLIAFVSPMAANSTLLGVYEKKRITSRQLFFALLVNSFPNALMHWRWWLPAIYSVLGFVGLIYFALILAGETIRMVVFLTISRFTLPRPETETTADRQSKQKPVKTALGISAENTWKMVLRILKIFFPVTLCVFFLNDLGFFNLLAGALKGMARFFPIPVESLPIIAAQFGNSLVAFAIAGNLFNQQIISAKDVILTLFVGRIFAAVMIALRMQLPAVAGVFGRKVGLRIVVTRVLSAAGIDLFMILMTCLLF
jgi:hypothetical protein